MKRRIIIESPKLGEGIYSPDEVAEILHLPYHKVKALIRGYWDTATFGTRRNRVINFLGLIEFYIYYYLRHHGWSAQKIKKLHTQLSSSFDTPYPFASLKIKTHRRDQDQKVEAWIDHDGRLIQADGKLQPSFREFIEPFLEQIEYGEDLLAKRFYPFKESKAIVIDPKKQFGQPIIDGNGVRTEVVWKFHLGGESNKAIASMYDLTEEQVEDAIKYHLQAA